MTRAELAAALREHAYLEGDFVLRSGRRSRYYLDKYRFETRPELLGPLGELIAATTSPEPTVGLVFYDLKTALRGLGEQPAKPKPKAKPRTKRAPARRTTRKKTDADS